MIQLHRDRRPGIIHSNFHGKEKRRFEKDLLLAKRKALRDREKLKKFSSTCWKAAKKQLLIETSGKCAYFESPTNVVAFGDVEHYRPKSEYWWLAYNYDNYLAACQLCNQKFKGADFPISGRKLVGPRVRKNSSDKHLDAKVGTLGPDPTKPGEVKKFKKQHKKEQPRLLNPYFDKPERFYVWKFDDNCHEVELKPLNQPKTKKAAIAQNTIEVLELNQAELLRVRYYYFNVYRTLRRVLEDSDLSKKIQRDLKSVIVTMAGDEAPYAGMIRFFDDRPIGSLYN